MIVRLRGNHGHQLRTAHEYRFSVEGQASADGRVRFIGTFSPVELTIGDKSNLFLATNSENKSTLFYPTGGNNGDTDNPKYFVKSCRAYFHVDLSNTSGVRAFSLHFDDDGTTGIVDNKRETITNNH